MKPLCLVLIPSGKRITPASNEVDFDAVYADVIAPSVEAAGLETLRADVMMADMGVLKPTLERLLLCDYAIVDLTMGNPAVWYEVGVRHAVRKCSTVLLLAEGSSQLPFDPNMLSALPYRLSLDGMVADAEAVRRSILMRLANAEKGVGDSPVFDLVEGYPQIEALKKVNFQENVRHSSDLKKRLAQARNEGVESLARVEHDLGDISRADSGVVIDLFLSYRAVLGWPEMIALVEKMSPPLADTVLVQEQLALALNRNQQGEAAEMLLCQLIEKRGPSSETYGLLGRVYKDRWEAAMKYGMSMVAKGMLEKAIEAYLKGFEHDWRDAYPGISAVTLMEIKEPPDPRRKELIPVVAYAAQRRIAAGKPDYWDYATLVELAVLGNDGEKAMAAIPEALARVRESWEPETTARNLRVVREARQKRQEEVAWAEEVEAEFSRKAEAIVWRQRHHPSP